MQTKSVQSFFYYMWNTWGQEECELVFKEQGWKHIWSKWLAEHKKGVRGASERFFCELDDINQSMLVERACDLYDGRARREKMAHEDELKGALCAALEGGSNYWYMIASKLPAKEEGDERFYHERMWDYLKSGGIVTIEDIEDDETSWELTWGCIKKGIKLCQEQYPGVWADIVEGSDDSSDADVWFQLCVIGEVVYC